MIKFELFKSNSLSVVMGERGHHEASLNYFILQCVPLDSLVVFHYPKLKRLYRTFTFVFHDNETKLRECKETHGTATTSNLLNMSN